MLVFLSRHHPKTASMHLDDCNLGTTHLCEILDFNKVRYNMMMTTWMTTLTFRGLRDHSVHAIGFAQMQENVPPLGVSPTTDTSAERYDDIKF